MVHLTSRIRHSVYGFSSLRGAPFCFLDVDEPGRSVTRCFRESLSYVIRTPPTPQITLGRSTKDAAVDIDLSLEGPAWKVSRKQGIIKLRNSGEFFIANAGKRPIFVDGKPVLTGNKYKLNDNSVVEVSCVRELGAAF